MMISIINLELKVITLALISLYLGAEPEPWLKWPTNLTVLVMAVHIRYIPSTKHGVCPVQKLIVLVFACW